jgi:glycosyltransferase involved in cell wall biosynthesis
LAGVRKIFLIIHNDAVPARSPFRWFESLVDWAVASCCARIITVSQACARQIETARPVFKNVLVIANGLDLGRKGRYTLEEKRQKLKIEPTAKVIGTIGNLESRKGHAYLLRAFVEVKKKCPEARLIVVGSTDSPEAAAVLALVKQLKLESSVTLTGYLDNAWEYVECFDLFVYPSVAFESFGFALLEAMRFAKPIVAAATGGIPEVVGEAGILVEPRQAGQLADAIIALLGDPACANLLAEKGAARLGALFSVERMADQYYALTGRRGE